MKKILTIVGARPQFIKAAALSPVIQQTDGLEEVIVHTGQHFDSNMSQVFFDELSIPAPKVNLGIGGGTHGQNTGRMIESLEATMLDLNPDAVLVFGDTDSTLSGAIAAAKLGISLVHVEAGLRSRRRAMPEEINRVLTDHASDILFAASERSKINLLNEGINADKIEISGDIMLDVYLRSLMPKQEAEMVLKKHGVSSKNYNFMTLHRKENTDDPLRLASIMLGIEQSPCSVLLSLHPRTQKQLRLFDISLPDNVIPIEAVGFAESVALQRNSRNILTDSGGVQKEAYFGEVPCITLRDETEWTELVECGANTLTGASCDAIGAALKNESSPDFSKRIYGNGSAGSIICNALLTKL